jgi:hypothetical protein
MNQTKQRKLYTPEVMLRLAPQIKERGDIVDIIERNCFSDSGFRKALRDYKGFYEIKNKQIRREKINKVKRLKDKLKFLTLAYASWRKGLSLNDFAKQQGLNKNTIVHRISRLGIFWKRNVDSEVTDNTFKSIISEYEIEIKNLERELGE